MADDLMLSGSGSTAVSSAYMLELAWRLRVLAHELDDWHTRLSRSGPGYQQLPPAMLSDPDPGDHCRAAARDLAHAQELASALAAKVELASELYGSLERHLTDVVEQAGAWIGHSAGNVLRAFSLLFLTSPLAQAAGLLSAGAFASTIWARTGGGPMRWLVRNKAVLSDPRLVAGVRLAVSSADNAILGFSAVPGFTGRWLDDRATGWFGRSGAARVVVGGANLFGLGLSETPVKTLRTSTGRAAAPTGYADLAARIPASVEGAPQVRVERYETAERDSWIIYVGGTIDTSFTAGEEPFDDTSNLHAVAELDPGSLRVALQALQQAGAEAGDTLLAVGYSQGGIIATDLAQAGGYEPVGLVTFGSPTAGARVPEGLDDVAVEHTEDVIPALGGLPRAADDGGLDRLLVRRQVLDDIPPRSDEWLPAHALPRYRATAAELDGCLDPRLSGIRSTLATVYGGGDAEVSLWRGDRVAGDRVSAARSEAAARGR